MTKSPVRHKLYRVLLITNLDQPQQAIGWLSSLFCERKFNVFECCSASVLVPVQVVGLTLRIFS